MCCKNEKCKFCHTKGQGDTKCALTRQWEVGKKGMGPEEGNKEGLTVKKRNCDSSPALGPKKRFGKKGGKMRNVLGHWGGGAKTGSRTEQKNKEREEPVKDLNSKK